MKTLTIFIFTFLLLLNLCHAQDNQQSNTNPNTLEELTGFTQTFYYSKGHKDRALFIAEFMERAGTYFQTELDFTPKTKIYVLDSTDWKDHAAKPLLNTYGFPHYMGDRLIVAAKDNDFWRSFLPQMNQLPSALAAQISKAYGNADGSHSMRPFFDLLALHELGHAYTSQAGLKMQRYWMGELFVNIMLHTYVAEQQPELLPALETFPDMVIAMGTDGYKHTNLKDFENLYPTLGMGPKNYGWYQSRLHSAAGDIYNASGKNVLKKLWDALKNHQEDMTDEAFVTMLKTEVDPVVANVFLNWNN